MIGISKILITGLSQLIPNGATGTNRPIKIPRISIITRKLFLLLVVSVMNLLRFVADTTTQLPTLFQLPVCGLRELRLCKISRISFSCSFETSFFELRI